MLCEILSIKKASLSYPGLILDCRWSSVLRLQWIGSSGLGLMPINCVAHQPWRHSIAWFCFKGEVVTHRAAKSSCFRGVLGDEIACLYWGEVRRGGGASKPVLASVLSYGTTGRVYVCTHSFIHSFYLYSSATTLRHVIFIFIIVTGVQHE
jgi:hypothetical protein